MDRLGHVEKVVRDHPPGQLTLIRDQHMRKPVICEW
jgi:hypothetical protein